MAKEITFKGKLVAQRTDLYGYIAYVFENLEPLEPNLKYVMCTQFPNWDQNFISTGDTGFVTVRYVDAGKDTWFDGTRYVPYRKTDIHFLKFVPAPPDDNDVTVEL